MEQEILLQFKRLFDDLRENIKLKRWEEAENRKVQIIGMLEGYVLAKLENRVIIKKVNP